MCGAVGLEGLPGRPSSRPRSSAVRPQASRFSVVGRADRGRRRTAPCRRARGGRRPGWRPAQPSSTLDAARPWRRSACVTPRSRRSWMNSSISSRSMNVEHGRSRLDQRHRHVERAEDRGVFDADDAGADHRQAARQMRSMSRISSLSKMLRAVERHVAGPMRPGADGDQDALAAEDRGSSPSSVATSTRVRVDEARGADAWSAPPLRANWCSSTSTSWSSVMCRRCHQVLGGDVLLDPVGAAVEAALAPAGEVEHGLAQGLRGDGAGVDRDAADAAALLDHQHATCRAWPPGSRRGGRPGRCR